MRAAAGTMLDWSEWEGECAGEFRLERYLGGSSRSAVFLTAFGSHKAAIKLARAKAERAAELIEKWNRAAALEHPHLLGIFKSGKCAIKNLPLAYVVMEYAEENLAAVLGERELSSEETLEMMKSVADVLAYLHAAGLAHGNVKPSNIFAVRDVVKVSCDTVGAGDPAADVFGLSKTMIQALTRWNPATQGAVEQAPFEILPAPFDEIAKNCFLAGAQHRWSSAEVARRLRSGELRPVMNSGGSARISRVGAPKNWASLAWIIALIVLAIAGALLMRRSRTPANRAAPLPAPVAAHLAPPKAPPQSAKEESAGNAAKSIPAAQAEGTGQGVIHSVLPVIPAKARKTVRGKAMVDVRAAVDSSGRVIDAKLERGSRYFGALAIAAARQWQFAPAPDANRREWLLRFAITKTAVSVEPRERKQSR